MNTLDQYVFLRRVRLIQVWWRQVLAARHQQRHRLVVARLAVINAMVILIQRWWRSVLQHVHFVPPSSEELRAASLAIVKLENTQVQRAGIRDSLLSRWKSTVSQAKPTRVGRLRPAKRLAAPRVVLNPLPVSGRYESNLSAAHLAGRSEWNGSATAGRKQWLCEPRH
jgi:hypothetical protein